MMGGSLEDPLQKLPWTIPQLVRMTDIMMQSVINSLMQLYMRGPSINIFSGGGVALPNKRRYFVLWQES